MNKSFTLIEILVVIVVIGVLSAFILVGMSSITSSANIAKSKAFLNSIDNSLLLARMSQWNFDELTTAKEGQSIRDAWNSNNGTLYTGLDGLEKIISNCPYGNCLSFDGSSDYVNCGNMGNTTFYRTNFTLSLWIYPMVWGDPNSNCGDKRAVLLTKGTSNIGEFELNQTNGGSIYLYMNDHGTGAAYYFNTIVPTNKWTQVVVTYLTSNYNTTGYVNSVAKPSGQLVRIDDEASPFKISGNSTNCANGYFNGSIDDVRIYNQAIPTSQIQQNYFIGLNNLYKNRGLTQIEYIERLTELKNNLTQQ